MCKKCIGRKHALRGFEDRPIGKINPCYYEHMSRKIFYDVRLRIFYKIT